MKILNKLKERWQGIDYPFLIHSTGELRFREIAEQEILKSNPEISDEELNMAINMTQKMLQPQWMATLSVLGGTFMGFFYSLIISFFLKKDDNNLMI